MWLLEIIFLQVYNEEQIGQKERQNVKLGEEKDTGKDNVIVKACARRQTGTVQGGQICIGMAALLPRPHSAELPTCERKRPKELTKCQCQPSSSGLES